MQYARSGKNHLIKIEPGEEIVETLHAVLAEKKITSGSVRAIGAATAVSIGYFDVNRKEYLSKTFEDNYEVVNLAGNVSLVDGRPFAHLHIVVGDRDYRLYGGHLFAGIVTVTIEIIVSEIDTA